MNFDTGILNNIIPQLGVSGLFIAVAWKLYSDYNVKIKEKDEYIEKLTGDLQTLYARNAELLTELRKTLEAHTKSLDANTQAIRSLQKKV